MSDGQELDRTHLRDQFIAIRGYWAPFWDEMLELDPNFFKAYLEFSSVPWKHGTLAPKVRELIYIAIDASATHMYEPGIRQHVRNAIAHGATRQEIMEVLELVSVIGIHACTVGAPILLEEWRAANEGREEAASAGAGSSDE